MERIGVCELRQNASRYLALVKAGDTIEVTERGKLVALLVAPHPGRTDRDRLIAEGRLIRASGPFGGLRSTAQQPESVNGPTNEQLLEESRAERL